MKLKSSTKRSGRLMTVAVAVATAAGLALSGCSAQPKSNGPVTLTFWAWVPGMEDAVNLWNKEHPDIHVKMNRIASSDAAKIASAVDAGTGPDIAQIAGHALPDYVINGEVQDITQYVGSDKDKYVTSAWNSVVFNGKVEAVPQDTAPQGMMYRKDILAQYGIAIPKTWDEYLQAARDLHAKAPDVYLTQFSPNEPGLFYPDIIAGGGSVYGQDGNAWTVTINSPKVKAVADRWQTLLDDGLSKVEQMWTPEYWADVNAGKIAAIRYSAWFPALLEQNAPNLSGKWAVAPAPSDTGNGKWADAGGSVTAAMKGNKHPQEAAEFATWLNTSTESMNILISKGGLFPAAKAQLKNPKLTGASAYFGGQKINDVFSAATENLSQSNVEGPGYDAMTAAMTDSFAKVANKQITFSQALDEIAAKTKSVLKQQGLTVK